MGIAIIVHGGAGPVAADDSPEACGQGCLRAARVGYAILRAGGSALDAVEAAAVVLEDDPLFNAGTGSTLTEDGQVEMDASIMSGVALTAGAVTCVRTVSNPIRLARAVMERTRHVLLTGAGAEQLAREVGMPIIDPQSLVTDRIRLRWEKARAAAAVKVGGGTIGAVAVDVYGHVAAATSTGGMLMKRSGRVGDTPLIGAGTYADDLGGAASCTGHGEVIIRVLLAKRAADLMASGAPAPAAAAQALSDLTRVNGEAGLILVDHQGRVGHAFNTARMSRAWIEEGREGWGFTAAHQG